MEGLQGPAWFGVLMFFLKWCAEQYWEHRNREEKSVSDRQFEKTNDLIIANNTILEQWVRNYADPKPYIQQRERIKEILELVSELNELMTRKDAHGKHLISNISEDLEEVDKKAHQIMKVCKNILSEVSKD